MRILHVINTLGFGGAEDQVLLLHRELGIRGHESRILVLGASERPAHEIVDVVVADQRLAFPSSLAANAWRIRKEMARFTPDLVHSSLMMADVACAAACLSTGTRHVATLCNVFEPELRSATTDGVSILKAKAVNRLWGIALRRCTRCIAISDTVARSGVGVLGLGRDRLEIIPRAVGHRLRNSATEGARERVRRALGLNPSDHALLAVGRLVRQKDHETLLRAFFGLPPASGGRRHLWIVGEGPMASRLKSLAADHPDVAFLGRRSDVPDLMLAADVFVFPSVFEGLGVSGLEAAWLGRPCVFSDAPALMEVLPDERFGWIFSRGNVATLSRCLLEALEDPAEASARASVLSKRTQELYSVNRMVQRTEALYKKAMGGSTP